MRKTYFVFFLIFVCLLPLSGLDDLVNALKSADFDSFKQIFEQKYSIDSRDDWGLQAIHYAAAFDNTDNLDFIQFLFAKGAKVEAKVFLKNPSSEYYEYKDFTPLIVAAYAGNIEALKYLVKQKNADIEYKTYSSNTAMDYACMNGHLEVVEFLLPLLKNKTVSGAIPHINWAIMYENPHIVKYLISKNVDLDVKYDTPAIIEAVNYYDPEVFKLMLKKVNNLNDADRFGNSVLISAVWSGSLNAVKELLKNDIDVNARGENGFTALHKACEQNSLRIAQLLINKGAKTDIKNNDGKTPLDIAVEKGYDTMIKLLKQQVGFPEVSYDINDEIKTGLNLLEVDYGDYTFTDMSGKNISLSDYKGRVIFLNIWATWCPPCRSEMPDMQKLHETYDNKDFIILAVSVDEDKSTISNYITQNNFTFKVLHDPLGKSINNSYYSANGYPTTYIINKQGVVVTKVVGSRSWANKKYSDFIKLFL